jgi:hypothetical protein
LAAAILWKARTLPRTPRAFIETRFLVDTSFRGPERRLKASGDVEREGGAVTSSPSIPDGSSLAPLVGCGRDDICSVDRSGQLWKLPLVVICLARFLNLTGANCCQTLMGGCPRRRRANNPETHDTALPNEENVHTTLGVFSRSRQTKRTTMLAQILEGSSQIVK